MAAAPELTAPDGNAQILLYVNQNEEQSKELLEMLNGTNAGMRIIEVHPGDGIDTPYLAGPRFQLFGFGAIRQFVKKRLLSHQ